MTYRKNLGLASQAALIEKYRKDLETAACNQEKLELERASWIEMKKNFESRLERSETPFSNLTPAETERLALLSEELGEAQQAIGKILRHGYDSSNPEGGPDNRSHLTRELGDVFCAFGMMADAGDVDRQMVLSAAADKAIRVGKYLHHQYRKNG